MKLFRNFSEKKNQLTVFVLASFWLIGVVVGCILAISDPVSFSLMRSACETRVSILWLSILSILPLFVVSVVVYYRLHYLIFPICALRAFNFGYCVCGVYLSFGSAGWLVCGLLLFSSLLSVPVLFWFCCRCLCRTLSTGRGEFISCLVITLLITLVDYLWVSPFLHSLMI